MQNVLKYTLHLKTRLDKFTKKTHNYLCHVSKVAPDIICPSRKDPKPRITRAKVLLCHFSSDATLALSAQRLL